MSDTDTFSPEELAALEPTAPQAQPPAKEEAPAPEPAPVEPPKAPEPVAEAPKPAEEPKPGPKTVPLAELLEERRKRQEYERQLAALQQPKPQEPQIPAFEQDPATHLKTRLDQAEEQIKADLAEKQRHTQLQQIMGAYAVAARDFSTSTPDFQEAYQHLLTGRSAELQAIGLSGPELAHALQTDELAIVTRALRDGANPAERLYMVAKARGWAPKPKEAPPAPPAPPAPSLVQEIAKGQQVATNPIAGAFSNPIAELTPATLAAMSDDEFAELSDAKWRKAMGG